jgi:hypothetical protein
LEDAAHTPPLLGLQADVHVEPNGFLVPNPHLEDAEHAPPLLGQQVDVPDEPNCFGTGVEAPDVQDGPPAFVNAPEVPDGPPEAGHIENVPIVHPVEDALVPNPYLLMLPKNFVWNHILEDVTFDLEDDAIDVIFEFWGCTNESGNTV